MTRIPSHLSEPLSALIQQCPGGVGNWKEMICRIIIFVTGIAHNFYYVSVLHVLKHSLLSSTWTALNPWASYLEGSLREVTGGKVQRAVPKSPHCWGIHAIWVYSMIHCVPIMPFICFIYYTHTSELEFISGAKPKSGHQSHKSRKPALNTHRDQCSRHYMPMDIYLYIKS